MPAWQWSECCFVKPAEHQAAALHTGATTQQEQPACQRRAQNLIRPWHSMRTLCGLTVQVAEVAQPPYPDRD